MKHVSPIADTDCYFIVPLHQRTIISEQRVGVGSISDQNCLKCVFLREKIDVLRVQ